MTSQMLLVDELRVVLRDIQEIQNRLGQMNQEAIQLQTNLANLQAVKARIEVDMTATTLEVM